MDYKSIKVSYVTGNVHHRKGVNMPEKVVHIVKALDALYNALSALNTYGSAIKVYGLLESMELIANNPCALKAWALKAKRVIKEV